METAVTPRTYPDGVPSWIDLGTPDPDVAATFYGRLFGWAFRTMTPPGVPRYDIITLEGEDVGGVGMREVPSWRTYVAVVDIEAAVAAATEAGAQVIEPVEAAGEGGWSATISDPAGIQIGMWQANERLGAQVVNRPGAWNFSDLHTDDPNGVDFYVRLFGWVIDRTGGGASIQVPGYGDHLEATADPDIRTRQAAAPPGFADVVGGLGPNGPGLAPHWHVTFSVADRDAAAATAERLGGQVLGSAEGPWSRTAVIRDPQGAVFTASELTPPDGPSGDGSTARSSSGS